VGVSGLRVPALADEVVVLRRWRERDVPAQLDAFSDPFLPHDDDNLLGGVSLNNVDLVAERCGFTREGVPRSHIPFKGTRRDTVVFSLLPGELRP
jgi:hypothetical protein